MNGKGVKRYDIINLTFDVLDSYLDKEIDYAGFICKRGLTFDQVVEFFIKVDKPTNERHWIKNPHNFTIEIYEVDEDDNLEFVDGSDYTPAYDFLNTHSVYLIYLEPEALSLDPRVRTLSRCYHIPGFKQLQFKLQNEIYDKILAKVKKDIELEQIADHQQREYFIEKYIENDIKICREMAENYLKERSNKNDD